MQSSILFGLNADHLAITQQVPTACSSGDCKWMEYWSLAMCSSCVDLTDKISTVRDMSWPMAEDWPNEDLAAESKKIMTTYMLPNGQTIGNPDVWEIDRMGPLELTVKNTARPSESLAFKSTKTLLQAVSILRANFSENFSQNWTSVPITATECALYFCINTYQSEMKNGTLLEQWAEVSSTRDPASFRILEPEDPYSTHTFNASMDALYEPNDWFNRSDLQIMGPQQENLTNNITTANISQLAIDSISIYLNGLFRTSDNRDWFGQFGCTGGARAAGSAVTAESYAPPSMQALANSLSLNATFRNLAASISANIRGSSDNDLMAAGQLGTYETFINVLWIWITLPCICIFLGTVFLILAIWETRKHSLPIWRSSVLAVMTHGLEDVTIESMEHDTLNSQIDKSAKGMAVTLGGKLKLERAEDSFMSSEKDHHHRETDPLPIISAHARHSSLFASQEIQALIGHELVQQHDA